MSEPVTDSIHQCSAVDVWLYCALEIPPHNYLADSTEGISVALIIQKAFPLPRDSFSDLRKENFLLKLYCNLSKSEETY